jgi:hypothetical protein
LEPNRIAPGKKTGWQPEVEAQDLIGLAGIGSDYKRPGFLILGPQEPTVK